VSRGANDQWFLIFRAKPGNGNRGGGRTHIDHDVGRADQLIDRILSSSAFDRQIRLALGNLNDHFPKPPGGSVDKES
jgi:hypothetical protein